MQPVKVTCDLASPLAGDAPMLDALVEWVMSLHLSAIMTTSNGARHAVAPRARGEPVSEPGKIPIPIVRKFVGGLPIPLCSSPILAPAKSDGVEHVAKTMALEFSHLLDENCRRVVNTTGDWTKSYRLPLRVRTIDRIVWFCVLRSTTPGVKQSPVREMRKLLRRVHSIGKKTADGYGRVVSWTVERIKQDWSWFAPSARGLVLMRPLPASAQLPQRLVGCRRDFGSPCPPYWQRNLYRDMVTPC